MSHGTVASRWNLDALEQYYEQWKRDPRSVDESWRCFFEGFDLGLGQPTRPRPQPTPDGIAAQSGVVRLIYAYRDLGHFLAHLDPLSQPRAEHESLALSTFGLTEADLDKTFDVSFFRGTLPAPTLRELREALKETYCGHIGVEYMHIQDRRMRHWLQDKMEGCRNRPNFNIKKKTAILKNLFYAEMFEQFLHRAFSGQKRFSLEGAETLIPLLEGIVSNGPALGVREIVLGMAHRGRLNVLANTLRKPYQEIFAQFNENFLPDSIDGDGDVKYHLGFSSDRDTEGGRVHVSLSPNPSHLEAVDPVVEGRVRAKQTLFKDVDRKRGLPLLLHGDAAFAGQGLVAETLNLAELQGYTTGGTIHVIVNNQIGFTTAPRDARSTNYCTDIGKMIQAPVFHVNSEDPEACVYVAEMALEFRQQFHRDVIIDMYCYRKHGHNEGDLADYTQPLMYKTIRQKPLLSKIYADQLVASGDKPEEEVEAIRAKFQEKLDRALEEVKGGPQQYPAMRGFSGNWKNLSARYNHAPVETGVQLGVLRRIAEELNRFPPGFEPHPKAKELFKERLEGLLANKPVNWPAAELYAFGSLLLENTSVRLSGQDSRRGTFTQRHSVLYDARTGEPYAPLSELAKGDTHFAAYDSMLSEAAVLGFEFGYTLDDPHTLVMWEAQFGDFANGAQVIIDQFIASSESKWTRESGLVMLLPHGYEGQGPEHSSARLERFLQLCAEDNIQVVYPSTPAQYFHMLRRQMKRRFRKPLIVMTPKSLLRHPLCVSPVQEFTNGRFHEVLDDSEADPTKVRRVVLCSGKVYYDLYKKRAESEAADVALVRLEQFYPFNEDLLQRTLQKYRRAKEWVWAQEESHNNGGWFFVEPRLRAMGFSFEYVGRDASASPATGSKAVHESEQTELVAAAIAGPIPHLVKATNVVRPRQAPPGAAGGGGGGGTTTLPGGPGPNGPGTGGPGGHGPNGNGGPGSHGPTDRREERPAPTKK